MSIFIAEFLHYFVNGVSKLQSTPVVALYLLFVALSPLWIRNVRPLGLRKVRRRIYDTITTFDVVGTLRRVPPFVRGVNRFSDRRIWPFCAGIADFSGKIKRIRGFKRVPWIADQLKNLSRIRDSVCLEVRIVDRIINFRSALVDISVFCRLIFSVSIFFLA